MLPDFPETKKLILSRITKEIDRLEKIKDPVLADIKRVVQHEGISMKFDQVGYGKKVQDAEQHSVEFHIKSEEVPDLYGANLDRKIDELAQKTSSLKMKSFFARVDEATEQTGKKVDAQGKTPDGSMLLDILELAEEDFDSAGESKMKWVLHPAMVPALQKAAKEIEDDPELSRRQREINARHREQWLARENRRKLVD